MAQVYKMTLGTSGRQWELLTVESDGRMTMTFHGTDREICHEVTENADGWLCYPGAMYPGLASGKWQLTEEEPIAVAAKPQPTEQPTVNHDCNATLSEREPLIVNQPSRPKRQRKARKPAVALDGRTAEHTSGISHQPSATLKAVGMVAAATVALFVIYETGLLIPLGLIGLATSGLLK